MENNSRRGPEASTGGWGPPITRTSWPAPPIGWPANVVHMSPSPFYISFPPPLRVHLRRCSRLVHATVIEGVDTDRWCGNALPLLHLLYIRCPLPPSYGISHSDQDSPQERSTKLSRCRSRIVRLRVRESCSGSGEIFGGWVYLCILPLQDLCFNIVIFSIYFYTFHVYG
jgi:hypothetical protein